MTTTFTVTTAADLTTDLADISTGADAATNTDYVFQLADNVALSSATLSLMAGSTLTLEGPGAAFIDTLAVTGSLVDETPLTGTITLSGGSTLVTSLLTDTSGVLGGGAITGSVIGLSTGGDTVTNDGSITDTDPGANGIDLQAGTVTNGSATTTAALISAASYGVTIINTGALTNFGTVSGGDTGVRLGGGGIANTGTAASIYGGTTGANIAGAGTITNDGTIIGGSFGAYLGAGTLTNGSVTNASALIDGVTAGSNVGIELGSGALDNFGTVGGHVGYGAVLFGAGTITNNAGGLIYGGAIAVLTEGADHVSNSGLIEATGDAASNPSALFFEAGGTLTNTATGTISAAAGFGVVASGVSLAVTNLGSIGAGIGVDLEVGGTLNNGDATHASAAITGGAYGVRITGAATTITNFGSISGEVGISLYGVPAYGGSGIGTITDAGTISSTYGATGTAIKFGTGDERLILDKTGVILGGVFGSIDTGATTTMEFASGVTGTLSGLTGTAGTVTAPGTSFAFQAITTIDIDAGAALKVADTGSITDLLLDGTVTSSGSLAVTTLEAASTGTADIAAGATLDFGTDQAAGSTIDFSGAAGTLTIDHISAFGTGAGTSGYTGPTIEGFAPGQTIDLADLGAGSAHIDSFNATTGLLQLSSGAEKATLKLAGSFAGEFFHVNPDAGSGTDLIVDGTPCYCRGTLIATETGERPVETLSIGDQVVTWGGALRPIRWIGRRAYAGAFAHAHPEMLPILIRQGALADAIPKRDLQVSPLHAMYLHGVLVTASNLVNGSSIVQVPSVTHVEYFHIELDTHDVIFAEGAAAETFADDASRGMFYNAAEYDTLYPDAPKVRQLPAWFAPFVEDGTELEAIRNVIAQRIATAPAPLRPEGRLIGSVDIAKHTRLTGWAQDEDNPEQPVVLRIRANTTVLADITANRYRADLQSALGTSGRHAFDVLIPGGLSHSGRHVITVERLSDAAPLHGSPRVIAPATQFAADLEADLGASIDALPPGPEQDRALRFLVCQTERLLQARAAADGAAAAREAHRRWSGKAAPAEAWQDPGKRALFIDDTWPDPTRDAGSQAVLSHVRAMQGLGYQVSFAAAVDFHDGDAAAARLEPAGIQCCRAPWYASVEEVLRRQSGCFDVVYLHRIGNASKYLSLARAYQPAARILYSVADLHHVRIARQAAIEARPALVAHSRHLRFQEFTAILAADATLTHSEAEAALIRREVHGARVVVAPWDVTLRIEPLPFERRTGVAFVAGFAHAPNVDAAHWFAEQIMPLVWRRNPAIEATIAGSAMPETVKRLAGPGLTILGEVPNLTPLYRQRRLAVAPLRYGAGIKGKVLEAFAHGLPCVMTEIAAEGLPLTAALRDAVGHTAEAIADAICHLHDDKVANMAACAEGRMMIAGDFSKPIVADALCRAIEGRFAPVGAVVPLVGGAAA